MLFLLLPKNVTVPKVIGKPSAFEAEQSITEAGLKLAPQVEKKVDPKATAGSVLGQTPDRRRDGGEELRGLDPRRRRRRQGDRPLRGRQDHARRREDAARRQALARRRSRHSRSTSRPRSRARSRPPRRSSRRAGPSTSSRPCPARTQGGREERRRPAAPAPAGDGGDKGGDKGGAGAAADIVIPAVAGQKSAEYAQKLGDLGLVPKEQKVVNDAAKGTIIRVDPEPGQKAAKGATVTFFVSAGIPQVAFDNGENVLLANGSNGKPIADIAQGPGDRGGSDVQRRRRTRSPSRATGRSSCATSRRRTRPPCRSPRKDDRFTDLAWAPTTDGTNVLALVKREGDDLATAKTSLCFAKIDADGHDAALQAALAQRARAQDQLVARTAQTLLVWGTSRRQASSGWSSTRARSRSTPTRRRGRARASSPTRAGRARARSTPSPSPDGKSLAVVSLGKSGRPELFVTKPNDFLLQKRQAARRDRVQGGLAAGRQGAAGGAGRRLPALGDREPRARLGDRSPSVQRSLRLDGDHPTFRPLNVE